uniref:Uncharacterized protein n=1 Tax=Amphimedon queenslandica TaxID=400682 RepID=A0A1X7TM16_AMPQE
MMIMKKVKKLYLMKVKMGAQEGKKLDKISTILMMTKKNDEPDLSNTFSTPQHLKDVGSFNVPFTSFSTTRQNIRQM